MRELLEIPKWIWHPQITSHLNITLVRKFIVVEEIRDCQLFLALTGGVTVKLDGNVVGKLQEDAAQIASFIQIIDFPQNLAKGEHEIELKIECTKTMPVAPVSIHLSDRLVGCIGFLTGNNYWLSTNKEWQSEDGPAKEVCIYGDEPYGDLENSPEWFAKGGFEDIASEPIKDYEILDKANISTCKASEGITLEGIHLFEQFLPKVMRTKYDIFYHLRKQREWQELRTLTLEHKMDEHPWILIDLGREYNARFSCMNHAAQAIQILWNGAESLEELAHYKGCITESFIVESQCVFSTLPQGYRYIKLYLIGDVGAKFKMTFQFEALQVALSQKSYMTSDLPLLDKIFDVSVHTNRICHQLGLWDGVKRDRLNWTYDYYLAGKADYVLWDDLSVLRRSIADVGKGTPYGYWMNSIASYTLWWMNNLWEYYFYTGDIDFIMEMKSDLKRHIQWLEANMDEQNGGLCEGLSSLIEWVPMTDKEMNLCMQALFKLTFDNLKSLSRWIPELELEIDWKIAVMDETPFLKADALITPLLGIQSGYVSAKSAEIFLNQCAIKDPVTPLSAYWFAECCSKFGFHEKAWQTFELVWGKMLNEGATTFWESVTLSPAVDVHGALTTYTSYSSYRMSLCHSWASTPVQWICRYVIGVEPIEPGYRKVKFIPQAIGGMNSCKGSVNTPLGVIEVEWKKNLQGEIESNIVLPKAGIIYWTG